MLKYELMVERAAWRGKNMHYLLIIKIKGWINKPEPKGTFVLSKAWFPTFCYPKARRFEVFCGVSLLGVTLWSIGGQDTEGEEGFGSERGGGGHAVAHKCLSVG